VPRTAAFILLLVGSFVWPIIKEEFSEGNFSKDASVFFIQTKVFTLASKI